MNTPKRRLGWSLIAPLALALIGCETAPTPPPAAPEKAAPSPAEAARAADAKDKAEADAKNKAAADATAKPENEVKSMPVEPPKGASAEKLSGEEIAAIKGLPAEEQTIALAQVVCPVSNEHLGGGGMGAPLKKVVDGKAVFLCCKSCEKDFEADPTKYLAKAEKK